MDKWIFAWNRFRDVAFMILIICSSNRIYNDVSNFMDWLCLLYAVYFFLEVSYKYDKEKECIKLKDYKRTGL